MERKTQLMVVAAGLFAFCGGAGAQMVVHAVTGMVKAVNDPSKTMDVTVESGATNEFKLPDDAKVALDFDNDLRNDSVSANQFKHVGDYAVVYYYGYDDDRTAVAVKDLGAGPFNKVEGTVVSFDKHTHTLKIVNDAGKPEDFTLSNHLVVDSGMSVGSGRSYDPHKGFQVRVTYTTNAGKNTAVFVRSRQ